MIRLFALTIFMLAGMVFKIMFQGDVTVTLDTPTEVVAGSEFIVQVTINKGDVSSFSRLLQNLPAGLTASLMQSANADFNFEEKRVRFIWLRMPSNSQVTVAYKVKVDKRLKGNFNINGKFSYIADNERRSVNIESNQITILPSPDVDPKYIVDINDYERLVVPYVAPAESGPKIACIRQLPEVSSDGKGYIINLLVSKERKEKFAKIEEVIPAGYRAESVTDRDAIFTFKNGTAKYLWMNLPASSFFIVSYKLVPIGGKSASPLINGKFSYLEEDKTISIEIKQTEQNLASIKTPEELYNLLSLLISAPIASLEGKKTSATETTQQAKVEKTEKPEKAEKPEKVRPEKSEKPEKVRTKESRSNTNYLLEPEQGIYYRVQLAAGHNPVNIRRYFKKYNLDKEVRKEVHEGWQKYSVGSFTEYKDARDYRMHIWNTTIIDDAFVAAYNNGVRITVQEALMVADQKWYK